MTGTAPAADLQCTCYRLRRATRRVTALYDEALAPLALTVTQMNVLVALALRGPRPMAVLAADLGMDASTMTRTLKPLLNRELVVMSPGSDRRVRRVSLTEAGNALASKAVPLWRAAQRRVEAVLRGDLARLHEMLGRLDAELAPAD